MDTFVCSSWYFLRYCDPRNSSEFASAESLRYWMPVDLYIGGAEHTNGHLLYSRFITKVLHKLGYINFDEPFLKLRHQGLILGTDGEKMSKSKGNVVNPDEVIEAFGADALRMYEMFMGPFDQSLPWNTAGIEGVRRFLNRVWSLKPITKAPETDRAIHKLTKKVTDDIEQMKFNTIVSSCMEFVNLAMDKGVTKSTLEKLILLMAPMTPHIAEEIYQKLGHKQSIFVSTWPKFDPDLLVDNTVTVVVQVNGKLRGTLSVAPTASEDEVKNLAIKLPGLAAYVEGKEIIKSHYVPGRVINLIVK
jgi:leucyl-tRNA synthetase